MANFSLSSSRRAGTERKDFTWAEAVEIKRAAFPEEKAAAKQRQQAAGPVSGKGAKRSGAGKLPKAVRGRASDKAARATGKKRLQKKAPDNRRGQEGH